jgi:hypothetical protein
LRPLNKKAKDLDLRGLPEPRAKEVASQAPLRTFKRKWRDFKILTSMEVLKRTL